MSDKKLFKVVDGPLGIRDAPNGTKTGKNLSNGVTIEVEITSRQEVGGFIWWKHSAGWSAERSLTAPSPFMVELSPADPSTPRFFEIVDGPLGVRDAPNGNRLPQMLGNKQQIEVVSTSRTEAGGYIWWKHAQGWSAEGAITGGTPFMKEVFPNGSSGDEAPADNGTGSSEPVVVEPPQKFEIPTSWKGKYNLQIAMDVKVRGEPSVNPRTLIIKTIKRGDLLECDMDTLTEAEGYFWVKHALGGWSAISDTYGKMVFLAEPGSIPGLIVIGPNGPDPKDLPGYGKLITQHPVALEDTQWFQYYGNNMFGYVNGKAYGYDAYSQGLHGGLDYGNSLRAGVKVYAGIEGTYLKTEASKAKNFRIFIKNGDYTFIYQHITSMQQFAPNQPITPDTHLATIEHNSMGGWDHLHFEIRYMDHWIINPLWLMTPELVESITKRFDPAKPNSDYKKLPSTLNFFYKDDVWGDQWTTPMEQPVIKLTGPCIGPRFQKK